MLRLTNSSEARWAWPCHHGSSGRRLTTWRGLSAALVLALLLSLAPGPDAELRPTAAAILEPPTLGTIVQFASPLAVRPGGVIEYTVLIFLATPGQSVRVRDIFEGGARAPANDYVAGSARLNGASAADPQSVPVLQDVQVRYDFHLGNLSAGVHVLSFQWKTRVSLKCSDSVANSVYLETTGAVQPLPSSKVVTKVDCTALVPQEIGPKTNTYDSLLPSPSSVQFSPSGRVVALAASRNGDRLYMSNLSGVWGSGARLGEPYAGSTWRPLDRPQPPPGTNDVPGALLVPTVYSLAVSPFDKNLVLAATANDVRAPGQTRNGVYRSTTGGESNSEGVKAWSLVLAADAAGSSGPVPNVECPEQPPGTARVGQVVFAPDTKGLVYAASGCVMAISSDSGQNWRLKRIPDGGPIYHVAVGPDEGNRVRRVYAVGDDRLWYSTDGGESWRSDAGIDAISRNASFGSAPSGFARTSGVVLAVEPGRPDHVYLAVSGEGTRNQGLANGPTYYRDNSPNPNKIGVECNLIKIVDADRSGAWTPPAGTTPGETIILELGKNNLAFDAGDRVIYPSGASAPSIGTRLVFDPRIAFVDTDDNGRPFRDTNGNDIWDTNEPRETLIYDSKIDGDNILKYNAGTGGDRVIIGTAPANGARLEAVNCADGSLWLGDFSKFSNTTPATWDQLPGPPTYFEGPVGAGCPVGVTDSGRTFVTAQATSSGYLLFFANNTHVFVAQGRPTGHVSWHRLDGPDASADIDARCDLPFVHVDPHAIAVSSDIDMKLTPSEEDKPFNQNSVLKTAKACVRGAIWQGNDGGVYLSRDCGFQGEKSWQLGRGQTTLQIPGHFAGVSVQGRAGPGLYFGTPDNDDFFSLDGGNRWFNNPAYDCGDCSPWFSDPAQPSQVLEYSREDPLWRLYRNPRADQSRTQFPEADNFPDPAAKNPVPEFPIHLPADQVTDNNSNQGLHEWVLKGANPMILTLANEVPSQQADFVLIRERKKPTAQRAVWRTRTLLEIKKKEDWDTKASRLGPIFGSGMGQVDVVQVSGGHQRPVVYVGDQTGLWRWSSGPACGGTTATWKKVANGTTQVATRFFVDPYRPERIYILDGVNQSIQRSDNCGNTWVRDLSLERMVTDNGAFGYQNPIPFGLRPQSAYDAVISSMLFDRFDDRLRFAAGHAGVFAASDGQNWERLLSTKALAGHPQGLYLDRLTDPLRPALYVGMDGRGLFKLSPIPIGHVLPPDLVTPTDPTCEVRDGTLRARFVAVNKGSLPTPRSIASILTTTLPLPIPLPIVPTGRGANVTIQEMAPGQSQVVEATLRLAPGQCVTPFCFLVIGLDDLNQIMESSEVNNRAFTICSPPR